MRWYRVTAMFEGVRFENNWTTDISPLTNAHLRKNSWGFHRSSYWQNIQLPCGFVWLDGKRENKTETKYFWRCCYIRLITLNSYLIQPEVRQLQRSEKRFSFATFKSKNWPHWALFHRLRFEVSHELSNLIFWDVSTRQSDRTKNQYGTGRVMLDWGGNNIKGNSRGRFLLWLTALDQFIFIIF